MMGDAGRSRVQLLKNIVEWGERNARFVEGISREEFVGDELKCAAVSKCVEVIGEASGEIIRRYPEFVEANPHLVFAQAYRTRNRLSHGYDTIDQESLWATATVHVPLFIEDVREALAQDAE